MNRLADAEPIKNRWLPDNLTSLSGTEFVSRLISVAITVGFTIGAIVFIFQLLTGGLAWMNSGGDKAAVEGAQKKITSAAIGLLVLFSLFVILSIVDSIFGINVMLLEIPTLNQV